MNIYKQIELAVIAHVRHSHTDYEKLIYMSGKVAARSAVESQIAAKLAEWKGEDGQHVDENETELVEYEEETTSESVPSPIVLEDEDDDEYSPPPADLGPSHPSNHSVPSAPHARWDMRHDADDYSPPAYRSTPVRFGHNALNDYSFDYRNPPPRHHTPVSRLYSPRPQHISPAAYSTQRPPPPHDSYPISPPDFSGAPRVHLRPLPPSPVPQRYEPARGMETRYRPLVRPSAFSHAHYDHSAPPRYDGHDDYEPAVRMVPYSPPQHSSSRPSQYYGAEPDYQRPPPQHRYVPPPVVPAVRYRPLSPDDVVESREQYSPLQPTHKRARPNDWNEEARPALYY